MPLSEQPCQSVTRSPFRGREFPCSNNASRVLFGVHLCGSHDRSWRRRLESGEKIRIHPERALPLPLVEGTPPPTADLTLELPTKRCPRCGEQKPAQEFYGSTGRQRFYCPPCNRAKSLEYWRKKHPPKRGTDRPAPADDAVLDLEAHVASMVALPAAEPPSKRCNACDQAKPLTEFYSVGHTGTPYGLCKSCVKARSLRNARTRRALELALAAPSPVKNRPVAPPPPEQQDARPPGGADDPPVLAGTADLSGLPVVPAAEETFPRVGLGGEAPAPSAEVRMCLTVGCPRPAYGVGRECDASWCLECQLEGKAGQMEQSSLSEAERPGRYVFSVEFICLLCGRFICNIKVADQAAAIQLPGSVKCRSCGGAPVRSGEVARQYTYTGPVEGLHPRRGRPPAGTISERLELAS